MLGLVRRLLGLVLRLGNEDLRRLMYRVPQVASLVRRGGAVQVSAVVDVFHAVMEIASAASNALAMRGDGGGGD